MSKVKNTFLTFGINFSNHRPAPPMQNVFAKPITCGGIEP
jgi:hypothetical protein